MEYKNPKYLSILPGYLENSAFDLKPLYSIELKNTLENIISNSEPERDEGVLEKVFSDKTKTLKSTIKAIINEIALRKTLDSLLLYRMNEDISKQNTNLMQLESPRAHYQPDLFMGVKSKKMQLEKNVLDLEQEKRKEYVECWRDLMFMKKYLLSALKDYWDLSKRRDVLADKHAYENENSKGC